MSKKLPRFEVEAVTNLSTNGVVFVRLLNNMNFIIKPGLFLSNVKISGGDIPRKIDSQGQQVENIWAFNLESVDDLLQFTIGEIVELSQD